MQNQIRYFLILFLFSLSVNFAANSKVVAAISTLKGNVMMKPNGSRKYINAYKGQMIKNGEWVKTGDGVFVAIVFLDGSNIKIQQKTEIRITSYRMTSKELKTNLNLTKGGAWSDVAEQGSAGEFMITTPTATASVKGTEFDLSYDNISGEATITVMSGSVEFAGELGTILANAMQSSKNGGDPVTITAEELPSWQQKTDPDWAIKLKSDKLNKQQTNKEITVSIQIVNSKSKKVDTSFSSEIMVESQNEDLKVSSSSGSSGSNSTGIAISAGRGKVFVNSAKQGKFEMIVNGDGMESTKIGFNYFQSKTQKKAAQSKLAGLASKKGLGKLNELIEGKTMLNSQCSIGSVDDVLQKLETGELVLDGDLEPIDNGDGTITIKMKVKPQ